MPFRFVVGFNGGKELDQGLLGEGAPGDLAAKRGFPGRPEDWGGGGRKGREVFENRSLAHLRLDCHENRLGLFQPSSYCHLEGLKVTSTKT